MNKIFSNESLMPRLSGCLHCRHAEEPSSLIRAILRELISSCSSFGSKCVNPSHSKCQICAEFSDGEGGNVQQSRLYLQKEDLTPCIRLELWICLEHLSFLCCVIFFPCNINNSSCCSDGPLACVGV